MLGVVWSPGLPRILSHGLGLRSLGMPGNEVYMWIGGVEEVMPLYIFHTQNPLWSVSPPHHSLPLPGCSQEVPLWQSMLLYISSLCCSSGFAQGLCHSDCYRQGRTDQSTHWSVFVFCSLSEVVETVILLITSYICTHTHLTDTTLQVLWWYTVGLHEWWLL